MHYRLKWILTYYITNPSDAGVDTIKGKYIASIEKVNTQDTKPVNFDMSSEPLCTKIGADLPSAKNWDLLLSAINKQLKGFDPELRRRYADQLLLNRDVFSDDKYDLGKTHVMERNGILSDPAPVYQKQFRIPK